MSTKTETETIEATFDPTAYATLFNKGLKRVVEVSKTSLDLAVEQNAEVLASYKQVAEGVVAAWSFPVRSGWPGF